MDAFEALVSMLLRHEGYWTRPSFKVELTKQEKRQIGLPSSPRWELDLVAYRGATNDVLVVECKSFLDSTGVVFRNGQFEPEKRYKLFTNKVLRDVVLKRLSEQLVAKESCAAGPSITLCLAVGKIAKRTDRIALDQHFEAMGWRLFDNDWLDAGLQRASDESYENDIAFVVSKLLLRKPKQL